MQGFTLALALVDAVPVLLFGASMILVAEKFGHPLFLLGALLSTLAGCLKVAWKLVLAIWNRDIPWLNKPFVPMQATGFLMMLVSFVLGFGRISWPGVFDAMTGFPSGLLYLCWAALMGVMSWYRKHKFRRDDAHANWTAQGINCAAQAALLLAILTSGTVR